MFVKALGYHCVPVDSRRGFGGIALHFQLFQGRSYHTLFRTDFIVRRHFGFERVVSITTEANVASRNVMAKLGFTLHAQVPSEWGILWVHALDR